jgi:hypothetical protein
MGLSEAHCEMTSIKMQRPSPASISFVYIRILLLSCILHTDDVVGERNHYDLRGTRIAVCNGTSPCINQAQMAELTASGHIGLGDTDDFPITLQTAPWLDPIEPCPTADIVISVNCHPSRALVPNLTQSISVGARNYNPWDHKSAFTGVALTYCMLADSMETADGHGQHKQGFYYSVESQTLTEDMPKLCGFKRRLRKQGPLHG